MPDLGPNFCQRLSADDTNGQSVNYVRACLPRHELNFESAFLYFRQMILFVSLLQSWHTYYYRPPVFNQSIYGPGQEILVLIAYAQKQHLRAHGDVSSLARGRIFDMSLYLLPNFVYARSEGSGETGRMRRLAWAFAAHRCDKNRNLVRWPNFLFVIFHE